MKAIVLVGGFGTRLRPLTLTTPKQLLPVVDRPMIDHVLAGLARHGVEDAVLALGYRPDAFGAAYPDGVCAGVRLHYSVEDEPLDTAGAIRFAAAEAGIDERCLVVNGDVLTDLDVTALWSFHEARGAEATIHLVPVDDPSRYGVVPTDPDGRVLGFIEKPPRDEAPTNWINAGTYVLEPSVLHAIPEGRPVSIERETFPDLARAGTLYGWPSDVYWVDAGTATTYLQVMVDLLRGVRGPAPAPVAADAVVHPTALVIDSVVMTGARVEARARLERSAVLPGASVGSDAVVVDSVVGPGASVGSAATLEGHTMIGDGARVDAGAHLVGARVPDTA